MPAAPAACTPITRTFGWSIFTAAATPEASPPPPIGTTMVSTSGRSSMISSPMVPCPAMTIGSSNGWMNVAPVSCWNPAGLGVCVVVYAAVEHDVRAQLRAWPSPLRAGAPAGMTMVAGTPKAPRRQRNALRVVARRRCDHTAGARSSSLRLAILIYAPRTLNEPVFCKSSVFR